MTDLICINKRLASFSRHNDLSARVESYLDLLPTCIATPVASAAELRECLSQIDDQVTTQNVPTVIYANRDYLNFLRLYSAAKPMTRFVVLHCDLEQAAFFAGLSNLEITRLATYWPGTLFDVRQDVITCGADLEPVAATLHAAAAALIIRKSHDSREC
jgi:hypothetical protein